MVGVLQLGGEVDIVTQHDRAKDEIQARKAEHWASAYSI